MDMKPPGDPRPGDATAAGEVSRGDFQPNGELILIVEDSATQAARMTHVLEQAGYRTAVAANGREALVLVEQSHPRLIMSDVLMPEMNGYELCSRLKADERYREIPVILVTSLSDPKDVLKGLECRADNFVVKPYEPATLLRQVATTLKNRELRAGGNDHGGVEVLFAGEHFRIASDKHQILDLLLSTYEAAVKNQSALNQALVNLRELNEQLEDRVLERTRELEEALSKLKVMSGLIPICSRCKKIRDDRGFWQQVETYVHDHSEATFTHGLCPDCVKQYFPK